MSSGLSETEQREAVTEAAWSAFFYGGVKSFEQFAQATAEFALVPSRDKVDIWRAAALIDPGTGLRTLDED
jgi:hypothetical protein